MRHAALLALALVLALPATLSAQEQPRADEKKDDRGGDGRGGPGGGFDEMPKQIARFLKDQVDLTTEQTAQIETIMRDAFREMMKRMFSRMGDPNPPSPEDARKEMEDFRTQITGKIKDILDEGQKKEFDVLVKEFETRSGDWEKRRADPGIGTIGLFEPVLPSKERTLVKTENALILSEDEKKVILPLVARVYDARQKLSDGRIQRRKDLDKALHAKAKPDEIQERLQIARERERVAHEELEKATAELREVLTLEQEARLVALGVIE